MAAGARYAASGPTSQKTPLPTLNPLLRVAQLLPSSGCLYGLTVLALSKYAKYIYMYIYCAVLAVLVRVSRLYHSIVYTFYCRLNELVLQPFLTVDSDPLMSCVGAVC
jgi:hypothetical protein